MLFPVFGPSDWIRTSGLLNPISNEHLAIRII